MPSQKKINWETLSISENWKVKIAELLEEIYLLEKELEEKNKLITRGKKVFKKLEEKKRSEISKIISEKNQNLDEVREEIQKINELISDLDTINREKKSIITELKHRVRNKDSQIKHERQKVEQREESREKIWNDLFKSSIAITELRFEKRRLERKIEELKEDFKDEKIKIIFVAVYISLWVSSITVALFARWLRKKNLKEQDRIKRNLKT